MTTTQDVRTMPAGRELDALVAKALGWTLVISSFRTGSVKVGRKVLPTIHVTDDPNLHEWSGTPPGGTCSADLPHFSTDIAAAWQVLAKLAGPGFEVELVAHGCGQFTVEWRIRAEDGGWDVLAQECDVETAPLAICRAALAAAGED